LSAGDAFDCPTLDDATGCTKAGSAAASPTIPDEAGGGASLHIALSDAFHDAATTPEKTTPPAKAPTIFRDIASNRLMRNQSANARIVFGECMSVSSARLSHVFRRNNAQPKCAVPRNRIGVMPQMT
jgi:hypothetical protein